MSRMTRASPNSTEPAVNRELSPKQVEVAVVTAKAWTRHSSVRKNNRPSRLSVASDGVTKA
jgi:hypothetical protein